VAHGEIDPRLRDAAARSPELAAMLVRKHGDPSSRYRRIALLVLGAALAIGILAATVSILPGALRARSDKRGEPAEEIDNSHYLRPLRTEREGPGEETAPFSGFAISVETEPPGALVTIAGVPRGEAPVLANVACKPGARLEIAAEKAGFRPARAGTSCREDTIVKLTVRLQR
jgi:hypothetical protein